MKRTTYKLGYDTSPEERTNGVILIEKSEKTKFLVQYKCCGAQHTINSNTFSHINRDNPHVKCRACSSRHSHHKPHATSTAFNQLVDQLVTKSWVVACD